jgi:hypothetical protein
MKRPAGIKGVNARQSQRRISGSKMPPFLFARKIAILSLRGPQIMVARLAPMNGGRPMRPICAEPKLYGGSVMTEESVVTGTVVHAVMIPYSSAM